MQGRISYQSKLFIYLNIDSFIPRSHLLRRIDTLLDLSFIRTITKDYYCYNNGRSSIDPELYFRMMLIGCLYGIASDRQLYEEIQYNLAYRWFCKLNLEDKVPSHSSMTRIRDRLGEAVFKGFFSYILDLCKKNGLLKSESIIMDSTLVNANASLNSLKCDDLSTQNNKMFSKHSVLCLPSKQISNKTHKSTSDPDASLAQMKSGTLNKLKYKIHNCVDSNSRVIVDTYATTGKVHDSQVCIDRIKHLEQVYNLKVSELIADRGYGTAEIIATLEETNIRTYVPLFSRNSGSAHSGYLKHIRYDARNNRFICSQGKYLETKGSINKNRQYFLSRSADCRVCPVAETCEAERRSNSHARIIRRNIYQDLYKKIEDDMKTPLFIKKMLERRWKIEGLFAEAKQNLCLKRAKYRGIAKMQIQAYIIAGTQNIKRLTNSLVNNL